jgi:hypothetical protein
LYLSSAITSDQCTDYDVNGDIAPQRQLNTFILGMPVLVKLCDTSAAHCFWKGNITFQSRFMSKLLEAIADEERLYFNEELRRPTKLFVIST